MVLVQGPDSGKDERFKQMVIGYEKDLLRMCRVYLRDAALAEDAVQEVFLKAYKSLDAFRGEASEKTWLMRIAVNVCKDFRRNAWFRFVDRRIVFEELQTPCAPPTEEHMALTSEIMRLPRKEIDVILLYYYQNMKIKEIAQALGITAAAVSGRLVKARKRLQGALEGGEGNDA